MQELRFVLIIVGALAIAALLFHGLWTSKKEGKSKFGDKPLGKIDVDHDDSVSSPQRSFAPEDDFEIIRKERKEPDFSETVDPLIDGYPEKMVAVDTVDEIEDIPSISVSEAPQPVIVQDTAHVEQESQEVEVAVAEEQPADMEVLVLNVHCAANEPFVGTKLFDSMQQNGLLYGDMDIFHRHADLSGTGKVLFSVANMMQPGTLEHNDPADFTTQGISFFMTLPCYGEADQNFKLMLKTAQQIADDLGGNVLDDARNLMTPDRLAAYRRQIQEFKNARSA
ncbi:cell division protein ZipA [Vibrio aestuarianus]|uniref:cell division protein ZipA n=1 Tax=Vibrio aestuarianus TaxID=28171 RepID=UPI00237C9B34|nr:cell division protein ZipA [Vibrio aestuarianus]MDE1250159.1 cell division protein ZipA [Vibrio aestuarianus]MDE1325829.1 cell division protein ZipA [Vibrio aestuarianus]